MVALAVVGYRSWREASNRGGQQPAEPFRIAGNLYYVGANDVTAFLLTGPEGHVLVTSHARDFGRYRKFRERATAKNPVDPFIDREGYLAYIDSAEVRFRKLIAARQRGR